MSARWFISAVSLCLISSIALAAPAEKPRKGKPADQPVLDLGATFTNEVDTAADGNLREWGASSPLEFQTLISGEYEYDWTGPKDLSATVAAQYGPTKIFFLVRVKDNAVVAKKKQWKSDRIEIWLASEDAKGKSLGSTRGILLDIGPMVNDGKATIKFIKGRQDGLTGAAFIGGDGYDFEIAVDYTALGKKSPVMDGAIRYAVLVRDWDQDDPNEDEAAIATAPINPRKPASIKRSQMGKIPLSLRSEIWNALVRSEPELSSAAWTKTEADIGGTALPEIIAASTSKLVVAGLGLDAPSLSWYVLDIPEAMPGKSPEITIKDVNGDKKPDIILKRVEHCTNGAMNATRTYIFTHNGITLKPLASYIEEQRSDEGTEFVRNSYKLSKDGISQKIDPKSSADMQVCSLASDDDIIPIITPGDTEQSRTVPYL